LLRQRGNRVEGRSTAVRGAYIGGGDGLHDFEGEGVV
jgi:hypothetical protein